MSYEKMNNLHEEGPKKDKILLMLLPFWTPLIPPMGISCLKSYLKQQGYDVTAVDANLDFNLWDSYHTYTSSLKGYIVEEKRGNFYNIAHEILRNHLMACANYNNEKEYMDFVIALVRKHYFCDIDSKQAYELHTILVKFYEKLKIYLLDLIEKYNPAVAGISTYAGSLPATLFAFKLIKEKFPHIKTVMGGGIFSDQLAVNSPNFKAFISKTPYIDKIIVGEGELIFHKYLQGILPHEQKVFSIQDAGGELLDLSEAVLPDFSDFDTSKYPQMASYTSRSCPFQCSFCSETVLWGKYRHKDPGQTADELIKLYRRNKFQLFLLSDSLLNPIIDDLSEEIIKKGISVYWDGYLRADKHVCDVEHTLKWRRGGFYRARLGVESGSQRILDLMDKRISPQLIKSAVSCLAYAGIKTTTYWVIGYPGETEDDFQQTLELIEELKEDIYEAECNIFLYSAGAQIGSDRWASEYGISPLYPGCEDMLLTQAWVVDTEPKREVIHDRVCRFVGHCQKLGIANPYSLKEVYLADKRWKALHTNAVPLITEFKQNGNYICENKKIGQ